MRRFLIILPCLLIVSVAFAQEMKPEPSTGEPPEEQRFEFKSGLQKGQEFTSTISSKMDMVEHTKGLEADIKLNIEGKVKNLTKNGTASIKGQAKGKVSVKTAPHPEESQNLTIEKESFSAEITNKWGFKTSEEQTFFCPGFEPLENILPEKSIKVGDEWNVNLTRTFMTFVFSLQIVRYPLEMLTEEDKNAAALEAIRMIESMKGITTLTFTEIKDNLAIIKGKVKEVEIENDAPMGIKEGKVLIHFDVKTGIMTLFESNLSIISPNEKGKMDIVFRQEIKLKEPRKEPEYTDEEIKDICGKSDIVAAVEVVVLEKREAFSYYVVKVLSELKGSTGREHFDVMAAKEMELETGEKYIIFLVKTEKSGRKMFKLTDQKNGLLTYEEKLLKRISKINK